MTPAPTGSRTAPEATQLHLNSATKRQLIKLYAADRHFSLSDIGGINREKGLRVTATGTEWALVSFFPAPGLPSSVAVEFQDTANVGVFDRSPGGAWRILVVGGFEATLCGVGVPELVLKRWGYTQFPCPEPTVSGSG